MGRYRKPELLRERMALFGHSYRSLARASGVSPSTLHRLMCGESSANLAQAAAICGALNISPSEIAVYFCVNERGGESSYGSALL